MNASNHPAQAQVEGTNGINNRVNNFIPEPLVANRPQVANAVAAAEGEPVLTPQERYVRDKSPELFEAIMNKNLWLTRSVIPSWASLDSRRPSTTEFYGDFDRFLDRKRFFEVPTKPAFNFTVNGLVIPFPPSQIWDCRPYLLVSPMKHFIGEIYAGNSRDLITLGPHTYKKGSYFLYPKSMRERVMENSSFGYGGLFLSNEVELVEYDDMGEVIERELDQCFDALSAARLQNNGKQTIRYALEKLFDRIEEEQNIDIWRIPESIQYANPMPDEKNESGRPILLRRPTKDIRNNLEPVQVANHRGEQLYSYRYTKNNDVIDVDTLLSTVYTRVEVDQSNSETLSNDYQRALGYIQGYKTVFPVTILETGRVDFSKLQNFPSLYDMVSDIENLNKELNINNIGKYVITTRVRMSNFYYDDEREFTYYNMLKKISNLIRELNTDKYSERSKQFIHSFVSKAINIILLLEINKALLKRKQKYVTIADLENPDLNSRIINVFYYILYKDHASSVNLFQKFLEFYFKLIVKGKKYKLKKQINRDYDILNSYLLVQQFSGRMSEANISRVASYMTNAPSLEGLGTLRQAKEEYERVINAAVDEVYSYLYGERRLVGNIPSPDGISANNPVRNYNAINLERTTPFPANMNNLRAEGGYRKKTHRKKRYSKKRMTRRR